MKFPVASAALVASLTATIYAAPMIPTDQEVLYDGDIRAPSSTDSRAKAPSDQGAIHDASTFGKSLFELAPGSLKWVTDEEKWELKRNGQNFFDVTDNPKFGTTQRIKTVVTYPESTKHKEAVSELLTQIETGNMHKNLEGLTSFYTRYYKSSTGADSSNWLFDRVNATLAEAGAFEKGNTTIRRFEHPWGQHSIIVSIPGQSADTVMVSAHQDSVNLLFPALFRSPGADDDGSGTVTILESLRVLLQDADVLRNKQENTIDFAWFSAEEGGLLGSQAVFSEYERRDRKVKAMLQQDMTGYIQGRLDAGLPEAMGVINDFVDPGLTKFIKKVITAYCDIPYVDTECGYACSDHASATKAGYPSSFIIESDFPHSNHKIHSTEDKIEHLSFEHMAQHAKLTIALMYELGFNQFD